VRSEVPGLVPARFLTPRDPDRRTMGPAVARVARALGTPLMPWQQYVADVGGEVDERGRFVYSLVIVTVPRQSGKTTLMLAQSVQRCLMADRRKTWHTAQTGQAARKKWRELTEAVVASPLGELLAGPPRKAAGNEALVFVNGSELRPHPPTRDGLHGEQGDHNDVDEAWAYDEQQGADVMQAIRPTHATRPGAQTWIYSTRGDRSSSWFHGLIEQGYAQLPGVALFDFGIPDDADPTDLDVIARHHPALGYTIEREFLAAERAGMPPGEYARAYGNRPTGAGERVIPLQPWLDAQTTDPLPAGRPAYGIAVAGDGSHGSIYAAVLDPAGLPHLELVERRPGRSWLVDRVLALTDRGVGIAVDRRGPAAPVADALELAGVELLQPDLTDTTAACQDFYDRIVDPAGPRIFLRSSEALDDAADVAQRRWRNDGAWLWRRGPESDPLEAAGLSAWASARAPEPAPTPYVMFA
jgi:hypothetical protein